jgi:hypothetical protein
VAVRLSLAYHARQPGRREVVARNLLPVLEFDRAAAQTKCRELFREFGLKLSDLWRYEAGCAIQDPVIRSEQ